MARFGSVSGGGASSTSYYERSSSGLILSHFINLYKSMCCLHLIFCGFGSNGGEYHGTGSIGRLALATAILLETPR